jgi:hypothetical protein
MSKRFWTDHETATAIRLKAGGLTYAEIARALDRTDGSINDFFYRVQNGDPRRKDGGPIWQTPEDRHFANNAVQGSARLRDEIMRVFGQ